MCFTRPRPIAWFWFLAAFSTCLVLGTWQVKRLIWKEGLIAAIEKANHEAPITTLPADATALNALEFRHVILTGQWVKNVEYHLFPRWYQGNQGYWIITPLTLRDRRTILINRGWVPLEKKDPATRPETLVRGSARVEGILRLGGERNYFTPESSSTKNIWFARDIEAMAASKQLQNILPVMVDRVGTQSVDALPVPSDGTITLRNDHLSYIITWYGIALGILTIFLLYHRKPRGAQ